ncbi:unnamed protein product, partial [Prunus brigantina]
LLEPFNFEPCSSIAPPFLFWQNTQEPDTLSPSCRKFAKATHSSSFIYSSLSHNHIQR